MTRRLPANDLARLLIRLSVIRGWSANKIAALLSNVPSETCHRAVDIACDWLVKHPDFPIDKQEHHS